MFYHFCNVKKDTFIYLLVGMLFRFPGYVGYVSRGCEAKGTKRDWHFVTDQGALSVALRKSSAQGIRSMVTQSYDFLYREYYHTMVSTLAFSSHRKSL